MSFGFGVGDFITIAQVSKLAWDTFTAIKNAPKEWRALESEVQSLAISLKSLDDADTTLSIFQYTRHNPQREQNLKELLSNSNNALAPMKALIERYRVRNGNEKRDIRDWLAGTKFTFKTMSVQEFRNKLALHTASLNIFLTTLTNTSLGRLEQLIINGQAATHPGVNLVAQGNEFSHVADDGFDGVWSAIGRDLALGTSVTNSMANQILNYRDEIREYVQFIASGGLPYSRQELSDRGEQPYAITTYSLDIPLEDVTAEGEDEELKTLIDAMVSFDGERGDLDGQQEEEETSFDNPLPQPQPLPVVQSYAGVEKPTVVTSQHKISRGTTLSTPTSQTQSNPSVRCDCCKRELLVGQMYLHCKICRSSQKEEGFDVCDACWEKGRSCPGKHRDERYFNHRERRIAGEVV